MLIVVARSFRCVVALLLILALGACRNSGTSASSKPSGATTPGSASSAAPPASTASAGSDGDRPRPLVVVDPSATPGGPSAVPLPEPAADASAAPGEDVAGSRPPFFEVTRDKASVYLLGSIHAAKKDVYPLPRQVRKAFDAAPLLATEVVLDGAELSAAQKLMAAAALPAGATLDQRLPAPLVKRLQREVSGNPLMPWMVINRLRPWFAAMMIVREEFSRHGYDPNQGIDIVLTKRARAANKPVEGIETIDDQVAIFKGLTAKQDELMLREALDQKSRVGGDMDELSRAWRAGNDEKLEELVLGSMKKPEYKSLYEAVLVKRNIKMVAAVQRYLAAKPGAFVVVGAAHLVGPDGMVTLLRKKPGVTVTRR